MGIKTLSSVPGTPLLEEVVSENVLEAVDEDWVMLHKDVGGKPQLHLLNKEFLDDMAFVRMFGNEKHHGEESWRLDPDMVYLDAAMRHLTETMEAFKRGDPKRLYDEESKRLHLASVGCNIMFVVTRIKERLAAEMDVLGGEDAKTEV